MQLQFPQRQRQTDPPLPLQGIHAVTVYTESEVPARCLMRFRLRPREFHAADLLVRA